jgi:hypothetical protein
VEIFSTQNEENFKKIFIKIRSRLHQRYHNIFFNFWKLFKTLKWNFNSFEKIKRYFLFFKSHFDYFNIKILKHHVNRLNINIMTKKIEIIKNLKFLVTLRNLKKKFDFFEYYCNFVSWYSFIEKSLIKFKTQIFKKVLRKDKQIFEWALKIYLEQSDLNLMKSECQKNLRKIKFFKICINAWKELKKQLCNAIIRIFSNLSRFFILYVDENKKQNFKIVLH